MPLKLEVKKKFIARSVRVKSVDIHPNYPWVLAALYSGNANIYDYNTQTTVKSFEVSINSPTRCAKFIVRKQWIVVGSDDLMIRVFNYNTMEKVKSFEAHVDFIRSILVHPSLPYVLSSSDDLSVKLWDWEKNWAPEQSFEGHVHYIMQICINPKDTNTFASASLDKTIKIWGLKLNNAYFTLKGHKAGVNCLDYCRSGDRPYLISGGDDYCIKIWDYQTKLCIHTIEAHSDNVSNVSFHPHLPIIISTSEDNSVKLWHSFTFKLETTIQYGMERGWNIDVLKETNIVAIGFDEGTIVLKMGNEYPIAHFYNGVVVMVRNTDVENMNLKMATTSELKDGEKVSAFVKELGSVEIYPQSIKFNSNGQLFAICGEDDYVIYTSRAFKNAGYGNAVEFVWSNTDSYAIRLQSNVIKLIRNSEEYQSIKIPYSYKNIFGGHYLGVASDDSIVFFDWETGSIVRKIEVSPKFVYWNEDGQSLILALEENAYLLKCNQQEIHETLMKGVKLEEEEGIPEAFELIQEINEQIESGYWIGQCFVYINSDGKMSYLLGKKSLTMAKLNKKMMILGYIGGQDRIYLIDKSLTVVSYELLQSVINYQTYVINGNIQMANTVLPTVPQHMIVKLAKFLETNDFKEEAFNLTPDLDHKFELAIQLGKIKEALEIANLKKQPNKYKQVGDIALLNGYFSIAEECFKNSNDLSSLLLYYTSVCDKQGIKYLMEKAVEFNKNNLAFLTSFLLNDCNSCINLLLESEREPEAALFARAYAPSKIPSLLQKWNKKVALIEKIESNFSLADPLELLEDNSLKEKALEIEKYLDGMYNSNEIEAKNYLEFMEKYYTDFHEKMQLNPNTSLNLLMDSITPGEMPITEEVKAEEELVEKSEIPKDTTPEELISEEKDEESKTTEAEAKAKAEKETEMKEKEE